MTLRNKLDALKDRLTAHDRLAIAFSGGVDSALLLKAAVDTLGRDNVLAITARAVNFPSREDCDADAFAGDLNARHLHLDVDVMAIPGFAENSPERCYHCKKALFGELIATARREGFTVVADGANADDLSDYRPGLRAVRELGVISPLCEAGLTKADVRALSRELGVPLWNKPSFACLASRFPYGRPIEREDLERVGAAEDYLLGLGLRNVRVRLHGDVARIEVDPDERRRFFDETFLDTVAEKMRALGFAYTALDLRGYRTGSLNEIMHNSQCTIHN